jgi:hypothetical protein
VSWRDSPFKKRDSLSLSLLWRESDNLPLLGEIESPLACCVGEKVFLQKEDFYPFSTRKKNEV